MATVETSELASIVRNERKVEYLRSVIQFFTETDEQFLRYGDYDAVATQLRGIHGIGEWSSYFILVRGLGRVERVSTIDQELAKAAARVYNGSQPLTPQDMQDFLERYGPYQGYWALYLSSRQWKRAGHERIAMELYIHDVSSDVKLAFHHWNASFTSFMKRQRLICIGRLEPSGVLLPYIVSHQDVLRYSYSLLCGSPVPPEALPANPVREQHVRSPAARKALARLQRRIGSELAVGGTCFRITGALDA